MKRITVLLSVACLASVTASAENEFARHRPDERLRALIAEKASRLRDYEKAAYVAALEQGGESVGWALRNLAASRGPVEPRPQEGKWWMPRHEERLAQIRASGGWFDLVFFGDSISHHWETSGKEVLAEIRKLRSVLVDGFSGDRTYNALWRARHGELDGFVAKVITLLIGTNNWADNTVEETAEDIRALVEVIRDKQPQAKLLLIPILPRSDARSDFKNRKADEINARIASLADGERVVWFDLRPTFAGAPKALMPDGLHPGPEGYVRWWNALKPHLQDEHEAALERPVLGPGEGYASWSAFYNRLFDLDAAADEAWLGVRDIASFDARRRTLRTKTVARLGGFPERTPLNARVTGRIARKGYAVEKVLFESRPGMFVTGNLYLPDSPRFKAPYPAALEVCGHSNDGKSSPTYRRIAILSAKNGLATLVIDPLGQGERRQCAEERDCTPVVNHLRLGVSALLLGRGFAAFELWDAMRALDYLETRPDLRHDGFGVMGNSGGGTQSVLLSAFDERVKATATSCFLCNLREQTAWRLLPDSEQMIFGQLADGVNHAAYPLLGGNHVLMLSRRDDMIPYSGTRATARLIAQVGAALGRPDWYGMIDLPGPHGYTERHMRATPEFLLARLGLKDGVSFDEAELDFASRDYGPEERELWVTPNGQVSELKGYKSAYSYLADELDAAVKARRPLAADARAREVRALADIDETRVGERTVVSEATLSDGTRVIRAYFPVSDGYRIPTVEFVPPQAAAAAPALVAADVSRTNVAEWVRANRTRSVLVADVCACGEIGRTKHHYLNPNDDEETAKMLYLLGSSLVGRRAGDLVALGRSLQARYGQKPQLVGFGRIAVAAAHAHAAAPGLFAACELHAAPPSWSDAVRSRRRIDYASAVHGALLKYDWTDIVRPGQK